MNHGVNVDEVIMDLVSNVAFFSFPNGIFIDLKETLDLSIVQFFENSIFDRRKITVELVKSNKHKVDVHLNSNSIYRIKYVWIICYLILSVKIR